MPLYFPTRGSCKSSQSLTFVGTRLTEVVSRFIQGVVWDQTSGRRENCLKSSNPNANSTQYGHKIHCISSSISPLYALRVCLYLLCLKLNSNEGMSCVDQKSFLWAISLALKMFGLCQPTVLPRVNDLSPLRPIGELRLGTDLSVFPWLKCLSFLDISEMLWSILLAMLSLLLRYAILLDSRDQFCLS
jgi:hypothetical protein